MSEVGVYSGVDPQVAAGFASYLDQTEPETDETPKSEEDRASSETETPAEVVEEPEEEAGLEESEEAPTEDAAAADDTEETAEEDVINTWADLSQQLEVEPGDLAEHIQFDVGEGNEVSLSTLVDSYRNGPSVGAEARAQVEQTRDELRVAADARQEELGKLTARLIQRIENHRAPEGGWDALREKDPSEYIRRNELQEADRRDAEAAIAQMEGETTRRKQEDSETHGTWVNEQVEKLYRIKPAWKDPTQGQAVFKEIHSYLLSRGFTEDQMKALEDANSIITVWEAAQYAKSQAKKPGLVKRLRKLPRRSLRASARDETAPQQAQNKARQARLDKYRKSGKLDDAAEFFGEHV